LILEFYIERFSGMSSEQFLASLVNNALYPNQIIPPSSEQSWPEPFGAILQPNPANGQTPIFATNLLQTKASILADEVSQNTNSLFIFGNSFLANTSLESGQFNLLARDNSSAIEVDPIRTKIVASLQESTIVGSELAKIIDVAQQQIASFFQQPDVANQLALAFGEGVNIELAQSISQQLPTIEVVPDSILGTANGAYATSNNTIFLAHSLVARGNQQEIITVLIEEIGHSIDAQINTKDAAGDEGEIFAKLVSSHLDQADYLVILAEDDSNQIAWQNQSLAVENSNSPSISVALTNDSGSSNTDRLSKDAGIRGQVTNPNSLAEFKARLDGSNSQINLRSKLQSDGSFNITDAQMRQLFGNLTDGSHTLAFTAKNTAGSQSSFNLSFVLDTTAPQLTFTAPNIIKNDGKLIGQIADSNLEQLTY
jgi:hypothetical protein